MLPGRRHLGAGLLVLVGFSSRHPGSLQSLHTLTDSERFFVAVCPHHSDLQHRHEKIRLQIIVTGGNSLPLHEIRGAMTSPEQPEFYPQYCFHLSPTVGKWCHLRAADVVALSSHPGFGGEHPPRQCPRSRPGRLTSPLPSRPKRLLPPQPPHPMGPRLRHRHSHR